MAIPSFAFRGAGHGTARGTPRVPLAQARACAGPAGATTGPCRQPYPWPADTSANSARSLGQFPALRRYTTLCSRGSNIVRTRSPGRVLRKRRQERCHAGTGVEALDLPGSLAEAAMRRCAMVGYFQPTGRSRLACQSPRFGTRFCSEWKLRDF